MAKDLLFLSRKQLVTLPSGLGKLTNFPADRGFATQILSKFFWNCASFLASIVLLLSTCLTVFETTGGV